ncbi:response regulator transcription factor [Asticcacaulis sp. AND118]|uniref:response regulator transcription factor n=1 Tax=Asticcacaulis sp. AND118 TaxID=2840468 RepID=UPI001CFFA78C|nr:helix-turn-helix transcriptional regulator [Asticcacaulis sp. AND118]UDF05149.1 helix-turn-helix transcriptional regulator [Asticcacaulis sp. AND118]
MTIPDPQTETHHALAHLTIRQKQILRLIAEGHQAKEIARLIGIGERTVKTHTEAARKRLDVATSREAARWLVAAEKSFPIGPEDRRPSGPMADAPDSAAISVSVQQTQHAAGGVGDFADEAGGRPVPEVIREPDAAPGVVQSTASAALFFQRLNIWLARLNPLSLLGLILTVALGATVLVSGLIFAIVGSLEALQHLVRYIR